ncbi:MAG: hypothetical protein E6925_08810 [Actinomyces sp.]|uniref:hypothetical protein n=1 Tax=Actinomyces sp. TaxID=29317 RepID=UPI0028FEA6A2|nr:hypothetical protein [Actinomyces sp.]MDU1431785.1 hypothetical protein [Actinomyces sp.]
MLAQRRHGGLGIFVEDAHPDGLDEVGQLVLHITATLLKTFQDRILAPMGLLVVVCQIHSQARQHLGVVEEALDYLRGACFQLILYPLGIVHLLSPLVLVAVALPARLRRAGDLLDRRAATLAIHPDGSGRRDGSDVWLTVGMYRTPNHSTGSLLPVYFAVAFPAAVLQGSRWTYAVVATLFALSTLFAAVKLRRRPAWLVTLILTLLALACLLSGFEWAYRALDLGAVAVMTVTAIFAALVGFIVSSPQVKAVRLDRALAIVGLFVTAAVSMPTVSAVGRPQLVTINAWDYWPPQSATPITVEYEDPFTGRSAKAQAVGTQSSCQCHTRDPSQT